MTKIIKRLNTIFIIILYISIHMAFVATLIPLKNCILLYITVIPAIYVTIYYYNRHIPMSLISFIWFTCNILLLSLFILGFICLYIGLPTPIHIEDLSIFSIYRYMFFLAITILGLIAYFLSKYFPSIQSFITRINFPYLKEEIRVILYTWDDPYLGNICCYILDNIYSSKIFRYTLMFIHLFFRGFIPLVQVLLFLNFILNNGDLRYNMYLLPLSFVSWIFTFLEHYFNTFFEGTLTYMRQLVSVTFKDNTVLNETIYVNSVQYTLQSTDDLYFKLTSYACNKGFTDIHLSSLANQWLILIKVKYMLDLYRSKYNYFGIRLIQRF